MSTKTIHHPEVTVQKDYDNVFLNRVEQAIALNINNNKPMYYFINIDSGPYRSYCFKYEVKDVDRIDLDFYSASRVFGFEHTIEDIANAIALS